MLGQWRSGGNSDARIVWTTVPLSPIPSKLVLEANPVSKAYK